MGGAQKTLHPPNSPELYHYVSLLNTISHSETSLNSLRSHVQSELHLLNGYFSPATTRLNARQPLMRSRIAPEGRRAVEERGEKWAELHAMEKYKGEIERLQENVRRREEVERRLRGLLKEVGETLLEREALVGEGLRIDAI